MKPNEYRCAICRGVFVKGWSDEQAEQELAENFGDPVEDCDLVCDDCYQMVLRSMGRAKAQ